jgi:two-component system response regulator DevR
MIRVFIVDDHEIIRFGIVQLLALESDIEVVGEAATVAEALATIGRAEPDVAILDVRLPDGSGLELCRMLRSSSPGVACLILTAYDDNDTAVGAVLAGASGYRLKGTRGSGIVSDIRALAAGRSVISPAVAALARRAPAADLDDPRYGALIERERQVLEGLARGMSNKQIGDELGITEKTVKNYVSGLLTKLGMRRRTQAAVYQLQRESKRVS